MEIFRMNLIDFAIANKSLRNAFYDGTDHVHVHSCKILLVLVSKCNLEIQFRLNWNNSLQLFTHPRRSFCKRNIYTTESLIREAAIINRVICSRLTDGSVRPVTQREKPQAAPLMSVKEMHYNLTFNCDRFIAVSSDNVICSKNGHH